MVVVVVVAAGGKVAPFSPRMPVPNRRATLASRRARRATRRCSPPERPGAGVLVQLWRLRSSGPRGAPACPPAAAPSTGRPRRRAAGEPPPGRSPADARRTLDQRRLVRTRGVPPGVPAHRAKSVRAATSAGAPRPERSITPAFRARRRSRSSAARRKYSEPRCHSCGSRRIESGLSASEPVPSSAEPRSAADSRPPRASASSLQKQRHRSPRARLHCPVRRRAVLQRLAGVPRRTAS